MSVVIEQVLLLLLFVAIGYTLCKLKKADSSHAKLLSCLCVYIFLPATIFRSFSTNFNPEYLRAHYPLVLASAVILIGMILLAKPAANLLAKDAYKQCVYRYSMTVSNYGYVGYALAGGIFGDQMLLNVMMFVLPVYLYTYSAGYAMLTKTRLNFRRLINPPLMAVAAGAVVGWFGIDLPNLFDLFLSKAAACNAPASMLLTGMVISDYAIGSLLKDRTVYVVTGLRLLAIPLAMAAVLKLLGLDGLLIPAIMVLAMPCGLNTVVFPKLVGEDCSTGAALAFVSSILCCVTIPLCLWIFGAI